MSERREVTKCLLACNYCRLKKAKCSGSHPCGTCMDHNEECVYPEAQRRTRKRKLEEREQKVEHQLARMEMMLRAATQQMPALAPDQQLAQTVAAHQEPNQLNGGVADSRSPAVPQEERRAVRADPPPRHPRTAEDADTEERQWPQNSEQDCASVQDNSIEVRLDSIGGQSEASVPGVAPTVSSSPRRQPSVLNSAVADYQDLLSSPNLDIDLPAIFTSDSIASDPCKAGPSVPNANATVSTPASRIVEPSGISHIDWLNDTMQHSRHDTAGHNSLQDRMDAQIQAQPSALVTPPSTVALDGPRIGSEVDADAPCDEDPEVEPPEPSDDNESEDSAYHISICSPPGVEWVSHQIGKPGFSASARRLSVDMKRNERLQRIFDSTRTTEPDRQTAFRWTKAYFETCTDSVFGVLDRAEFEGQLQAHFQGSSSSSLAQGKAWYALRNTVYALGCRVSLSQEAGPAGFVESRTRSWQYFENALAVHTDLIYGRPEVASVRVLVLMAFYAEALGSPALEYMLLSNATRLAQSKGLHLGCPEASKPQAGEALSRQWLWWVLYAYEKHVAYRSGRPSAIDEDYVNCPIPNTMATGSSSPGPNSANIEFVRATIKHAQISSAISKHLISAKAMRDSLETTMTHVQALEKRLDDWHNSLHPEFVSSPPFFTRADRPRRPGTQTSHILFLHFCYHSSVIAIHGVFCYPWNRPDLQQYQQQQNQQKQDGRALHISSPQVHAQIESSTKAVAESSRQIILAVQGLEITSAMPLWLTFFFPLVGMINLFVYILKNPLAPSVASDLSLLDVVVGHFGYLQFISSSEHVFPFPREIAAYARHAVEAAAAEKNRHLSTTGAPEKHRQRQRQKQSRHHLLQPQQTQKKQQVPQVVQDGGLYGGFMNGQDMLLQQMATFPPEGMGGHCNSANASLDLREDWYGAAMPPLPHFVSFGMGTSGSPAEDDDLDFLIDGGGQCQQ